MKFVIGVDGSAQAQRGAAFVALLPLTVSDEVVVVSAAVRPALFGAWSYAQTAYTAPLYDEAWRVVQANTLRATERAAAELVGLPCAVHTLTREGHPVDILRQVVREQAADVLVVGPHGTGIIDSILMGSVSQSLLASMPASILVAREPVREPVRVLLAYDGSPHSLAALRLLAHFPLPAHARITVLAATGALVLPPRGGGDPDEVVDPHLTEATARAVEELHMAGRAATPLVRHGDAKRAILAAATELDADLVVMGARGVGGFRGMVLGSVSRAVSKAAPCAVLVAAKRSGTGQA